MSEIVGKKFERVSGPPLTAEVKSIDGEQAMCRLRRPSGSAFTGLRPVPVALLVSDKFRPIKDRLVSAPLEEEK